MELLTKFGINWQLLIAQAFNFVILLGILSYFIYKPFLRLLDERRLKVKQSMDDVKRIEEERKAMEEWKREHMRKVDSEASAFLESAKAQADKLKRDMLESAQKEADAVLEKAKQQLEVEKTKMVSELKSQLGGIVVKLTEKVLEREFTDKDESRLAADIEKTLPALLK